MEHVCRSGTYDDPNAERNGRKESSTGRRTITGMFNAAKHVAIIECHDSTHNVRQHNGSGSK